MPVLQNPQKKKSSRAGIPTYTYDLRNRTFPEKAHIGVFEKNQPKTYRVEKSESTETTTGFKMEFTIKSRQPVYPLGYVDGASLYAGYFAQWLILDPTGYGRFDVTPLGNDGSGSGFMVRLALLDMLGLEPYHEAYHYDDGSTIGYPEGEGKASDYSWSGENENQSYDDDIVKEAYENIKSDWDYKDYDEVTKNCQHFCDALRDEYEDIKREDINSDPSKREERKKERKKRIEERKRKQEEEKRKQEEARRKRKEEHEKRQQEKKKNDCP